MSDRRVVYLAGGIDGLAWDQSTSWRQQATTVLQHNGFDVIDPTAGRDLGTAYDPGEVVGSALANVDRADVLLVEMSTPGHAYIGTSIEIRKAWEQGKPVICWGLANRSSYFLLHHATLLLGTLEEALGVVVSGNYPRDVGSQE